MLHAYVGAHVQSAVVGAGDAVGDGVVTPPPQAQHIVFAVKSSSSYPPQSLGFGVYRVSQLSPF